MYGINMCVCTCVYICIYMCIYTYMHTYTQTNKHNITCCPTRGILQHTATHCNTLQHTATPLTGVKVAKQKKFSSAYQLANIQRVCTG